MKLFALLIILGPLFSALTQSISEATKVDQIGITSCEALLAHSQALGSSLKERPSMRAVVVTYSTDKVKIDSRIKFIHRYLVSAFENQLNVSFLKIDHAQEARTEFWLVPPNAVFDPPGSVVSLTIPFKVDRKLLFGYVDPDPCTDHIIWGFANLLKSDPSLSGYIVVINDSKSNRARTASLFREEFKEHGILSRGIRIFFKSQKSSDSYAEYWLYPKNR